MKKYIMFSFIFLANISILSAQKIKDSEVPAVVKENFLKSFPDVNAKWERENTNYEAGFKKDGKMMSATFQTDGSFLESEINIPQTELPPLVLNYVQNNYKGQKIKESAKITGADGTVTYEAEVAGRDLIFDKSGGFLKAIKD